MDFHQPKVFASVFRHKSFTKASDEMCVSQPTISEHIKNLEHEFSCKLFDRLGRTIAPTQRAERLYPKVLRLLDNAIRLQEEFKAEEGQVQGELIIGASTIPGTYILPRQACLFRQQYPDTSFEISIHDSREIIDMVLNHSLLCGVVGAKMENQLHYVPLTEDELVLVAAQGLITTPLLTAADLAQIPLLMREEGSGTRDSMIHLLEEAGISLDTMTVVATLGSSAAVKEAVKEGLGAAWISRIAVQDSLSLGELVEIPYPGLFQSRRFYLVTHKKRTLPHHYQVFYEYLRASQR
ncbi:MAG: LysR family transcriptional regulator [Desulfobulbaceae bacterium]|nr:LysR family transcriptional regulator [Desulfobulbaceae bacterium]